MFFLYIGTLGKYTIKCVKWEVVIFLESIFKFIATYMICILGRSY